MRKYILVLLVLIGIVLPFFMFWDRYFLRSRPLLDKKYLICTIDLKASQENILKYLKFRKDSLALEEAERVLSVEPDNLCALWAKAEVLRRTYRFKESQDLLNKVLSQSPHDAKSLISIAHIKYRHHKLKEASKILSEVLKQNNLDKDDSALVYVLMGAIKAKRVSEGGFLSKITYGVRIKGLFEKAKSIAPDLPEVYLGLGSFYLFAPKIIGGDLEKAIEQLQFALELAPDFATVNARLAQAYKKNGDFKKYNFYLQRARELDPENEVLKEIKLKGTDEELRS